MYVKPATPELLVANPEARPPMPRHLPADGAEVPDTEYWRRRLRDGDVVLASAPAHEAAATPPPAPKPGRATAKED